MLLGDNFFMKFKFVEVLQNYNFGFYKIIEIQLYLNLQEFFRLVNSASHVDLILPRRAQEAHI